MCIVTTSPTNATNWQFAHRVDAATRGTAGTQLGAVGTAPRPANMNIAGSAVGQVFALGASAVKSLDERIYKTGIVNLIAPCSAFIGNVARGGRPLEEAPEIAPPEEAGS